MVESKLERIRQYCDTTGTRLSNSEKELLYKVLENPEKYNGFESKIYTKDDSGRDYRDTWTSRSEWQYKINTNTELSIDKRWYHSCDGYVQDEHWLWPNAWHITKVRDIIKVLQEIEDEL